MSSGRWFSKRDQSDRGRAQARPESSRLTSLLRPFFSNRGSPSPGARQDGESSLDPLASALKPNTGYHVQSPDSVPSPNVVTAPITTEQTVAATSSNKALRYAYDVSTMLLPLGAAAAEAFPPAKAAITGIIEIVKLVEVSPCYLFGISSDLCAPF